MGLQREGLREGKPSLKIFDLRGDSLRRSGPQRPGEFFNRLSPIFPVDTLAISSGLVTAPRKRRRLAGSEASVLDSDTGCREGACSLLPTSEHAH